MRNLTFNEQDLKRVKGVYRETKNYRETSRITGVHHNQVRNWILGINRPRASVPSSDYIHFEKQLCTREITPDLAYVYGVALGDGYVGNQGNRMYTIELRTVDKDFADYFQCCLERWSGLKCYRYYFKKYCTSISKKTSKVHFVRLQSKQAVKFVQNLSAENITGILIKPFLQGLYDSEGCVVYYPKYNQKGVHFYNTDFHLVLLVKNLLEKLGIQGAIISKQKLYAKKSVDGAKTYNSKPWLYTLSLNKKEDIEKFYMRVGLNIQRKQKTLKQIVGVL